MKIRTMTLVMAGASILASGALATSSAQATTHSPERHLLEWCHKTFGEEQHDLCNYYNWAKDVAHRVRSENDTQYSEDFEFWLGRHLTAFIMNRKRQITLK